MILLLGIVESNRQKFRLEQAEVDSRKKFISETQYIIKKMKEELNNATTKGKLDNDQRDVRIIAPKFIILHIYLLFRRVVLF